MCVTLKFLIINKLVARITDNTNYGLFLSFVTDRTLDWCSRNPGGSTKPRLKTTGSGCKICAFLYCETELKWCGVMHCHCPQVLLRQHPAVWPPLILCWFGTRSRGQSQIPSLERSSTEVDGNATRIGTIQTHRRFTCNANACGVRIHLPSCSGNIVLLMGGPVSSLPLLSIWQCLKLWWWFGG